MFSGGVALVLVPVVVWILLVSLFHEIVAVGFGKNGGCSNAGVGGIAPDNTNVWQVVIAAKPVAINQ